MTTDAFTEAARAEAAERFPFSEGYEVGVYQRRGFVAGAGWARSHLAAQEPTLLDRVLAVMPEDARAHWDAMDDERQRWGGGVCRCYLCDTLIATRRDEAAR